MGTSRMSSANNIAMCQVLRTKADSATGQDERGALHGCARTPDSGALHKSVLADGQANVEDPDGVGRATSDLFVVVTEAVGDTVPSRRLQLAMVGATRNRRKARRRAVERVREAL